MKTAEDLQDLESVVEKLDNVECRNNIKFRGLKEGAEGTSCRISDRIIY